MISANSASTWTTGPTSVLQLSGPVTIDLDNASLTADEAVVWLTPVPGEILNNQHAQIALIGHAKIRQGDVVRESPRLFVTATVRGTIRITAEERLARDLHDSDLFAQASRLREQRSAGADVTPEPGVTIIPLPPSLLTDEPTPLPALIPATSPAAGTTLTPGAPVNFVAKNVQNVQSVDDKVAIILSGGVTIFQRRENGDFIELQAESAVLFSQLHALSDLQNSSRFKTLEDSIESAFLEGDVRIRYTPAAPAAAEQRLSARRIYYEFGTDRAILTDAVLHTLEPTRSIPVIVRANTLRQLALGEYRAEKVELTTSSFRVPTYSIKADKAYVRQTETGDPSFGNRTSFRGNDVTLRAMGVPFFWLPYAAGSITDRGGPLRDFAIEQSSRFGWGILTEWGLFETLGRPAPRDLNASYRLDYYTDRGPAGGLNARYGGELLTETTQEPWGFEGELKSYFIYDHGDDSLGGDRTDLKRTNDDFRGRIRWQHQQFLPADWQVQLTAAWVSDPTFLEEWFRKDFRSNVEHDVAAYFKRQRDTEALTLLVQFQPNDFVTTSDMMQEQFEIERLPEIGYHRIGESLLDDQVTLISNNTVAGLSFNQSDASLSELGFPPTLSPGIPAQGQTGVDGGTNWRGDFREEVSFPFAAGEVKVLPYVVGRFTPYSDSPDGGSKNRLYAAAGTRFNTTFFSTDDSVQSDLFDLHRVRHIVSPELHLYTSATTVDRNDLFIYDEEIDGIHDVSAAQIALRQRWQTKRGGPGRWRSVDFFTFNLEGNAFVNQPDDDALPPGNFRGLFFASLPEASIPRNSVNADAMWRLSDTTAILSDVQWNADHAELATASIGLAVQRDVNTSYYIATRYIEELNSNIATVAGSYKLSTKYRLSFSQSYDFSGDGTVSSGLSVQRKFDRFTAILSASYSNTDDFGGVSFSLVPDGLGRGVDSGMAGQFFGQ